MRDLDLFKINYYLIFLLMYIMNKQYDDDEQINIFEYVRENIFGLLLLLFAIFIVYIVDHINRINTLIYAPVLPFPSQQQQQPIKPGKSKK